MSAHGGTCGPTLKRLLREDADGFRHRRGSTALSVCVCACVFEPAHTHTPAQAYIKRQASTWGSYSCLVTPLLAL